MGTTIISPVFPSSTFTVGPPVMTSLPAYPYPTLNSSVYLPTVSSVITSSEGSRTPFPFPSSNATYGPTGGSTLVSPVIPSSSSTASYPPYPVPSGSNTTCLHPTGTGSVPVSYPASSISSTSADRSGTYITNSPPAPTSYFTNSSSTEGTATRDTTTVLTLTSTGIITRTNNVSTTASPTSPVSMSTSNRSGDFSTTSAPPNPYTNTSTPSSSTYNPYTSIPSIPSSSANRSGTFSTTTDVPIPSTSSFVNITTVTDFLPSNRTTFSTAVMTSPVMTSATVTPTDYPTTVPESTSATSTEARTPYPVPSSYAPPQAGSTDSSDDEVARDEAMFRKMLREMRKIPGESWVEERMEKVWKQLRRMQRAREAGQAQ